MASPVLLVADDLSTIAAVKRVLAREGYEVILATSAADAVIAWGHHLPGLVLLQPSVESDRGAVVLEELQAHPDAQLLRVVLLGESLPGFGYHVEPLPLDGAHFASVVAEQARAADDGAGWSMSEPQTDTSLRARAPVPDEPEAWRATRPPDDVPTDAARQTHELIEAPTATLPVTPVEEASAPAGFQASASVMVRLFGDLPSLEDELHRDVEAQAMATVESSLATPAVDDDELQRLEDEVRAEAARRRALREANNVAAAAPALSPPDVRPMDQVPAPAVDAEQSFADVGSTPTPPPEPALDQPRSFAQTGSSPTLAPTPATVDEKWFADEGSTPTPPPQVGPDDEQSFASVASTPPPPATNDSTPTPPPFDEPPTATLAAPPDRATARELLARAEAIALESRSISQSQRQAADADARRQDAELDNLKRRAEHAEALVRRERDARAATEDQLEQLRDEVTTLTAQVEGDRRALTERFASDLEAVNAQAEARLTERERQFEAELGRREAELERREAEARSAHAATEDELRATLARVHDELQQRDADLLAAREALEATQKRLELTEQSLDLANGNAVERAAERESLLASLTHEQEAARKAETLNAELSKVRDDLTLELRTSRAQLELAGARVKELSASLEEQRLTGMAEDEAKEALEARLLETTQRLTRALEDTEASSKRAAALEQRSAHEQDELRALEERLADASRRLTTSTERQTTAEQALAASAIAADALKVERDALLEAHATMKAERAELEARLAVATQRLSLVDTDLDAHRESIEAQRARADEAEALAQLTTERLKALEHRQVMNLALPGRRALGVPRSGAVTLEQLAHLVSTLVAAEATVRLELGTQGGSRTLWFKRGALNGAESTFDHESLIDRARRDGLIDARQEAELRLLRTATASEQLEAMKARGLLRDIETVPLLQRATEAVALEAFSEASGQYRLSDEPAGAAVLQVAVPRPTLPLLAEALRRAMPVDELLERLGGGEAICVATDAEVDLRAMGFTDKERKMLSWVDAEASIEDLTLASGLRPEVAFRALLVAKLLGVIEVKAAEHPAAPISSDLEVNRLEAKYDEVQDADYFSILGLPRSATSDDVQRASRRLAEEFDPIRYTGHPDPSLQQRAQVVSSLIEEAARALEDERRRAEYARHLLD